MANPTIGGKKQGKKPTKKQIRELEQKKIMFSSGVREGSRMLYQAFAAYCGLLQSPPEAVADAEVLLKAWISDGSANFQLKEEDKKKWDNSVFSIFYK